MQFSLEKTVGCSLNVEGYNRQYKFKFYQEDVSKFAEVTGDDNPIHLDIEYAKNSVFKKTIVHGFLVGSIFSRIFGTDYPGEGTIYLFQDMNFLKPVYVDKPYFANIYLEVVNKLNGKATLITTIFDENMQNVFTGKATLINKIYKNNK